MSLNKKSELRRIALNLCRELRRRQTPAEKIVWERVRNKKLMGRKFYRQHPLFFDNLGKETFYIADFYCYQSKLVVELDGPIHLKQKKEDQLRDNIINDLGIRVIRFKNEIVENETEKVIKKIKMYL
jgi:very-short-patch-repair endonuclease